MSFGVLLVGLLVALTIVVPVDEMLEDAVYTANQSAMEKVLGNLRKIAQEALEGDGLGANLDDNALRCVFALLEKIAAIPGDLVDVPREMYSLFELCRGQGNAEEGPGPLELRYVELLSQKASPSYALQTLSQWADMRTRASDLLPPVQQILWTGARRGVTQELSGALLHINRSRGIASFGKEGVASLDDEGNKGGLWTRMLDGTLAIEK